ILGVVTSDCAERPSAAVSPTAAEPAWWCASDDGGRATCQREPALCEQFRTTLKQGGRSATDCAPTATAYCFVNTATDGIGELDCAPTNAACQSWRDHPGQATSPSECAETH